MQNLEKQFDFLEHKFRKQYTNDSANSIHSGIAVDMVYSSIKKLKNHKAPDIDSIDAEHL